MKACAGLNDLYDNVLMFRRLHNRLDEKWRNVAIKLFRNIS